MPATGSPAVVPADVVKDYLFVLKNALETHVKVTTILADFRGDPLADAELERLCKVFTDELGVGIAVALFKLLHKACQTTFTVQDQAAKAELMMEYAENKNWAEMTALYKQMSNNGGPLTPISKNAKFVDDIIKPIIKLKKVLISALVCNEAPLSHHISRSSIQLGLPPFSF